jgi:hypothetical protein
MYTSHHLNLPKQFLATAVLACHSQSFVGNKNLFNNAVDRLCGLVVRVPGYTTEMYCVCCEVRTEFIYVM